MTDLTRIYFDLLNNLFSYLLSYILVKETLHINISKKEHLLLLSARLLYSIPATIPFQGIIGPLFTLFSILIMCYPNFKKAPHIFLKFEFLTIIGQFFIQLLHTLITLDLQLFIDNPYYKYCKMTICTAFVYICCALYINGKRMKLVHSYYQRLFTAVIISISLALTYLTLFICQTTEMDSPVIPILFSALFALIAVCINIYKRFIDLLEENMHNQILLEQNKMSADYSIQIENNLKELHSLRHDIRNHLLTVDGYAVRQDYDSIHEYIGRITDHYTDTPLFDTPSNVVSALLNAKHQIARQNNIDFSIEWNFSYINIEDFSIITLLGNLIDNAITASGKCNDGWITLSMIQTDSYLEIHIKNNHNEAILEKNGSFQSTHPDDGLLHGLGIKNIRSTVAQLNGHIDISYTDSIFDVTILIPNY